MTNSTQSQPNGARHSGQRATIESMLTALGIDASPHLLSGTVCCLCGKEKHATSQVCKACYDSLRRNMAPVLCVNCGVVFERKAYEHAKQLRKGFTRFYCTNACRLAHQAVRDSPLCPTCGKPISKGRGKKYCSRECIPSRKILSARICAVCGVEFQPKTHRTAYCCNTCADAAHSVRMRGSGNSRYKDGTSYAKWFREMRPLILDRDGDACAVCGERNRQIPNGRKRTWSILTIHHIDHNPRNNQADNLITLCRTCHGMHHKSSETPFPALSELAVARNLSMTFRWKERATSLRERYSSTIAS